MISSGTRTAPKFNDWAINIPVMYRLLFTNRWAALTFVGIMGLSAIIFASAGADNVTEITEQTAPERQNIAMEHAPAKPVATATAVAPEPVNDEDLIDQAKGTPPTPTANDNPDDGGWGKNPPSKSNGPSIDPWASNNSVNSQGRSGVIGQTSNGTTISTLPPGVGDTPKQGVLTLDSVGR